MARQEENHKGFGRSIAVHPPVSNTFINPPNSLFRPIINKQVGHDNE